jgi:hypothetical protein
LAETQRRVTEIDNGMVQLVSAEEVKRRIQAILQCATPFSLSFGNTCASNNNENLTYAFSGCKN